MWKLTHKLSHRVSLNGHGYAIIPSHPGAIPISMATNRTRIATNGSVACAGGRACCRSRSHSWISAATAQGPRGVAGSSPVRVVRRGLAVLAWTLPAMLIQALCLILPGHAKVVFARVYWAVSPADRIEVRVIEPPRNASTGGRWFMSRTTRHGSMSGGGRRARWLLCRQGRCRGLADHWYHRTPGRTVFVSRSRASTVKERDSMRAVLKAGDNLILFPEGTSSDGSRVLRSDVVFCHCRGQGRGKFSGPSADPAGVSGLRPVGRVAGRACQPAGVCLVRRHGHRSHFWRLTQHIGLRATVLLHSPSIRLV